MSKNHWFVHHTGRDCAVVAQLKAKGVSFKEDLQKVVLACPLCQSDESSVEAVYTKPTVSNEYGTYKCSRCAGSLGQFLNSLGLKRFMARNVTRIYVTDVPVHELAEAVNDLLASSAYVFRVGKTLYWINEEGAIIALGESDLVLFLSRECQWVKYDARQKSYTATQPPNLLVKTVVNSASHRGVKEILGIARSPYVLSNGFLSMKPGFNANLKILAVFDPKNYLPFAWSERLTKEDALEALNFLNEEILRDFPFQEDIDRSAALSAFLTAANRSVIQRAPLFLVAANSMSSGKSVLCRLIGQIATPLPFAEASMPTSQIEMGKTLLSQLQNNNGVVIFDNVIDRFPDYPSLCTCLTQPLFEHRQLHSNTMKQVSTRVTFLASGNFIRPEGDLIRRVLTIQLAADEHPEQRRFYTDIVKYAEQHRPEIVMKAVSITAAFLQSGELISCRSLAGFEEWTERCRKPLIWLGLQDPATRLFVQLKYGDETVWKRYRFLKNLSQKYGDGIFTVKDLCSDSLSVELRDSLIDLELVEQGQINRVKLGRLLGLIADYPIKGLILKRVSNRTEYRVTIFERGALE